VFSENAGKTIDSLNPEFVLGFSATPVSVAVFFIGFWWGFFALPSLHACS